MLFFGFNRRFRLLAYVFISTFLILAINGHSKPEYLGAAYAPVFAAGGVAFERTLKWWRWAAPAYTSIMLLGGIVLLPVVLPILPVQTYIRWANALGIAPSSTEAKQLDKLPQFYADMFGWEQKAGEIAKVYHSLTPEDQARCAIFGDNYGRCGAVDFYGPKYGLPKSIGRHNSYWIWGPRQYTGELMIILGGDLKDKQRVFESVEVAGTVSSEYCMPYENNLKIYVCRNLKVPLRELWPRLKNFG